MKAEAYQSRHIKSQLKMYICILPVFYIFNYPLIDFIPKIKLDYRTVIVWVYNNISVTQEDSIGKGKGKETVFKRLRTNLENRLYDFAHALSKCGRFCPRDRSFYFLARKIMYKF